MMGSKMTSRAELGMHEGFHRVEGEKGGIIRTGQGGDGRTGHPSDKLGMKHAGPAEGAEMVEEAGDDCSEASLRRITGEDDLRDVRHLALAVDTTTTQVTLQNFSNNPFLRGNHLCDDGLE